MTLTEQAIATIAAGCEGVTEGPYNVRRSKHPVDLEYDYSINSEDAPVFAECFGRDARGGYPPTATNAAHFGRLDPATVLALCALAQEALQSRREGQQMREALRHLPSIAENFLLRFNPYDMPEGDSQQWQALEHEIANARRALNGGTSDAE